MKTNITYSMLATLALSCFAFSEWARAALPSPAPDGGYPNYNTAEGDGALFSLTTGEQNTAIGAASLSTDKSGSYNTATGAGALNGNETGSENTAIGAAALYQNFRGSRNTAIGVNALEDNAADSANDNTGTGHFALEFNQSGSENTANGSSALNLNITGDANTAIGFQALFSNQTGYTNTATGLNALYTNSKGYYNTASGVSALFFNVGGHDNLAEGYKALLHTTGNNNVGVGSNAGANLTGGSNNIDIGANVLGTAGEANTIRIGKQGTQKATFIAGIAGTPISGSTVVVNSTGKLGVATSSAQFKEAIKPMGKASEALLGLKPVTFRYKEEVDPDGAPQFGLIAEDVEKIDPQLVVHDEEGKPFTVRYEAVNAMLLNEFLKEHQQVQKQQGTIAELKSALADEKSLRAEQQKQIDALTSAVQKVSDKVEVHEAATH